MDMGVFVEIVDPHNARIVCIILTDRNRIRMYVIFFYQSMVQQCYTAFMEESFENVHTASTADKTGL